MNHCVPSFELEDEDYTIPTTSGGFVRAHKKSAAMAAEEDIMELLWQDGQVVFQSQNQRSLKKSNRIGGGDGEAVISVEAQSEIQTQGETTPHLFMQEDEMSTWLHMPFDDASFGPDLYANLLHPSAAPSSRPPQSLPPSARSPIPPLRRTEVQSGQARPPNFPQFSRLSAKLELGPSNFNKAVQELTIVESNETPAVGPTSKVSNVAASSVQIPGGGNTESGSATAAGTSSPNGRQLTATCERTVTSSPGVSGASFGANTELAQKEQTSRAAGDRKRKGVDADDTECHTHSEDVDFESKDLKKHVRGSTSTKRSRAAEVHNLSERRRRDRINEKMKALQELIPRCNKSDKASMLDEAIEYLKSLQLQVQMMSMGCGMFPMMFPGFQQYMPTMGMGMAMNMDMGINRPMVPIPPVVSGSVLPSPANAAPYGPTFPRPAFHMPLYDTSRNQATNQQSDAMVNPLISQNSNQTQMPNFADPYQQFLGLHQMQVSQPQNQMLQPSTIKSSRSREVGNRENHPTG